MPSTVLDTRYIYVMELKVEIIVFIIAIAKATQRSSVTDLKSHSQ